MSTKESNNKSSYERLTDFLKSWFPIMLTTIGLISGYILFKSETEHRFQIIELQNDNYDSRLNNLAEDISRNKTEWQREVDRQLISNRESIIIINMRLDNLDSKLNDINDRLRLNNSSRSSRPSPSIDHLREPLHNQAPGEEPAEEIVINQ